MILARAACEVVVAHARRERPNECCGLLVGSAAAVVNAVEARNLAVGPSRFLIDPQDHIRARRDARARGLDVVGFYHSHPQAEAVPSRRDLDEASYPVALYLIVGLAGPDPDLRLYRFTGTAFDATAFELGA